MENKELYLIEGDFLETLKNYFHTRGMRHTEQLLSDILTDIDVSVLKERQSLHLPFENIYTRYLIRYIQYNLY